MKENWDRAINHVLLWEGGSAIRPNEPGGAVNMGVSLTAFREEHPEAEVQDLLDMSKDEAKRIFKKNYADKIGFDLLPSGYDLAALHAAVMFGVTGFKRLAEGVNGNLAHLIIKMMQNKMHREPEAHRYMRGWSDRFVAIYEKAKKLENES